MARRREFDLDRATERAMKLFWRRGYAATSVRDLCAAMGINSGSFYAAYGGKAGCFERALVRYARTQPVPQEATPAAIRAWFDVICDPRRTPKGCLVVDAAVEAPLLAPRARAAVQASLRAVERFFTRCLADRGAAAGADAALLAAAVTAVHVLARAGASPPELRAIAVRALAATRL